MLLILFIYLFIKAHQTAVSYVRIILYGLI